MHFIVLENFEFWKVHVESKSAKKGTVKFESLLMLLCFLSMFDVRDLQCVCMYKY